MDDKNKKAIEGIRVLDMTQFLSGPYCTTILADLGADVIKIERPDRPTGPGPYVQGESVYNLATDRGKRSITLNLKDSRDKEIFMRLVEKSDVIIHNFRPGTVEKMGVSYEEIVKCKPDIIYTAISGFGQTGPYRHKGALDTVIQAMSGIMSLTGEKDGKPYRVGTSIGDIVSGLYAAVGTVAAIGHRERTGEGQYIDIAMLDSAFSCLEVAVTNYFCTGKAPTRNGNKHQTAAPFQPFKTKDGDIVITANRNASYAALCKALGREDLLADERFVSTYSRKLNEDALEIELERTTAEMTMAEIEAKLEPVGVPTGRINTVEMVAADPQIVARNMVFEVNHPLVGPYKVVGSPLKMSRTMPNNLRPCPMLGQHTEEILQGILGMSAEEVAAFQKLQREFLTANNQE